MNDVDVLVVGAGALGLACAARLAEAGHGVLVAERERLVGSHTSSRNSEVIHAGLYYPPGSLKADLCLEGRERLYAWCARHGVGHRRIGKLLVAVEENEREKLQALAANARACGVDDLMPLDGTTLRALEPQVRGVAALLSPSTGIIDSHAYLQSLQAVAERHGAQLALDTGSTAWSATPAAGAPKDRASAKRSGCARAGWSMPAACSPRRWRNAPKARSAPGAGAAPVPGALFLLQRPLAVPPPGLPDARGAHRRARHPRHPRPRRPVALRSRRELRGQPRLPRRRIPRPRLRPGHLALLPRHRPSAPGRRLRRHPAQARRAGEPAADFIIQTLPNTACPAWSTCSASSRPASPPAWRSPNGSPEHSETRFRRAQGRPGKTALLYSPAHSPLPAQRIRP